MLRMPVLMHPIGDPLGPLEPRPLTDEDITHFNEWMQKAGLKRIARDTVRDAVLPVRGRTRFIRCASISKPSNGMGSRASTSG